MIDEMEKTYMCTTSYSYLFPKSNSRCETPGVKMTIIMCLSFGYHRHEHMWSFGYANRIITVIVSLRRLVRPVATHEHIAS